MSPFFPAGVEHSGGAGREESLAPKAADKPAAAHARGTVAALSPHSAALQPALEAAAPTQKIPVPPLKIPGKGYIHSHTHAHTHTRTHTERERQTERQTDTRTCMFTCMDFARNNCQHHVSPQKPHRAAPGEDDADA
jgi:hypothetical protein